jgi:WhiB family transcriptional regulator, redox-sensing transcriptional regulator
MTIPYIPAQRGAAPPVEDWRDYAACRHADPELFFPIGTAGAGLVQADRAKRVCAGCPVRAVCLDWALTTGQDVGIWGGTVPDERRAMRAQRAPALSVRVGGARHHQPGQFDPRAHAELAEDLAQVVVHRVP